MSIARSIARESAFVWGRAWPIRAGLTSKAMKSEAIDYIQRNQSNLLFVLGSGRSGTQLLARLLNASGEAAVFHEPNYTEDVCTMDSLRRDLSRSEKYWRNFRAVTVYRRWKKHPEARIYGEVNGTIRYQTPAIKQLFPQAKLMMMARDGRGVVRSVMGWPQFYGEQSRGAFALAPLPDDPFYAEWPNMNRFERICWSWQDTYRLLMRHIEPTNWLKLEQLVEDFEYFNSKCARLIGLSVPHDLWVDYVSQKSPNATKAHAFPSWEKWRPEETKSFERICGNTMRTLGYFK